MLAKEIQRGGNGIHPSVRFPKEGSANGDLGWNVLWLGAEIVLKLLSPQPSLRRT